MALPPLTSARPESPERGGSSPTAGPRSNGLAPLAPLRGSVPSDVPSPSSGHVGSTTRTGASMGSTGAGPVRSISGGPDTARGSLGGAAVASPPASHPPSRRGSVVSPRVVSGPRKLTKAQLAERLHGQLLEVLRTEWPRIKTSNLGVLSGTAVVEELLLRRIQAWAAELHMLAMTHLSAAERMGALCRGMDPGELQQLLVMLDQTGHPELSDYVRVLVFNTSDPSAKTVVGDLRALRAASSANRRARSTPSTRRRQGPPPPAPRVLQFTPEDPSVLRFAGLLPEGHRLIAGAHAAAVRRRQEEEEERRAAEAREARARARLDAASGGSVQDGTERRVPDASARQSVLLGRSAPPELQPYYLADLEETWRVTVSTRLPAEGVFDNVIMLQEPLPMYEAPPEAALLRVEAEEAALAPPSRTGLAMASVTSRAGGALGGGLGARGGRALDGPGAVTGGAPGQPGQWNGPLNVTSAASHFKRLSSAKPGGNAHTGAGGGGGTEGGTVGVEAPTPGSAGPASSRFRGASRPRLASLVSGEDGGEGGAGEGAGGGAETGRAARRGAAGPGGGGAGGRLGAPT